MMAAMNIKVNRTKKNKEGRGFVEITLDLKDPFSNTVLKLKSKDQEDVLDPKDKDQED